MSVVTLASFERRELERLARSTGESALLLLLRIGHFHDRRQLVSCLQKIEPLTICGNALWPRSVEVTLF